jgi:RHS repeat-associated protein
VTEEQFGGHGSSGKVETPYQEENGIYSTGYGFILASPNEADRVKKGNGETAYRRDYVWDYQNRLIKTQDPLHTVQYRYGADGQRAVKYSEGTPNETMYFNNMWQVSTSAVDRRWLQSKHIFVGETRIATKNGYGEQNSGYETEHQYWYHGDHLGSAQVITDYEGELYERIEYTPYGETWIEHKYPGYTNTDIPYRFTSKELDAETGFYYYGARYLDPRTSRWLSGDPALGDYIPGAPVSDEVRERNGNLPGQGGVFNLVNLHVYHYAGNNPVKYTDPNGRDTTDEITAQAVDNIGTGKQDNIDKIDIAKLQDVDFGGWEVLSPDSDEQKAAHSTLKDAAREDNGEALVASSLRPAETRGEALTEEEEEYNRNYFNERSRLNSRNQLPPTSLQPPYSPRPFARDYKKARVYYEAYKDNNGDYKVSRMFIDLNGDGYIDGRKNVK